MLRRFSKYNLSMDYNEYCKFPDKYTGNKKNDEDLIADILAEGLVNLSERARSLKVPEFQHDTYSLKVILNEWIQVDYDLSKDKGGQKFGHIILAEDDNMDFSDAVDNQDKFSKIVRRILINKYGLEEGEVSSDEDEA